MRKCLILIIILLSSVSAQNWTIELVDTVRYVDDCVIAIDANNCPNIVYCDNGLGPNRLKYAKWNGIAWEFQPVETAAVGQGQFRTARLCLDNQNHPHIAYAKDSVKYKYAYYDGNSWQISRIDSFNVHLYDAKRGCIDMALSETGVPHISYSFINYTDSISGIKYASRSGDSWIIQTVWQDNRILTSYLSTLAIDLDNAGYPVIAFEIYHPRSSIDTGFLYCASFNGQTWKIDTVEIVALPFTFPYWVYSLKVNSPDQIHIFYQCVFSLFLAKSNGDSWAIEFIDSNGFGDAAGDMILDGDKPNVVYSSTMDPLTYAYKVDTLWNHEIIDTSEVGLYPSIAQDNENRLHVSYSIEVSPYYLCYAQRESPSIAEKGVRSIVESKALIEIYPNPAKSVLRVRGPFTEKTVKVFDITGKMIKEIATTALQSRNDKVIETKISLKGISSGIYFLRLGKETKKFLVLK